MLRDQICTTNGPKDNCGRQVDVFLKGRSSFASRDNRDKQRAHRDQLPLTATGVVCKC